jgi:hypothetical protein
MPSLSYNCEIWTLKQSKIKILQTAVMKSTRCTSGYSLLDRRKNEDISDFNR